HPGDRIVAAEGKPVRHLMDFDPVLDAGKNKPVRIEVQRGNQRLPLTLAADADKAKPAEGYRGILPPSVIRKFSLGPAIRESIAQNQKMAKMIFAGLGKLVRGRSKMDDWAGPVSIARISGAALRASLIDFLGLMALVSVNLGILNLMPVPVLDGGHIFIILVEAAARRDLSIATKERVQQIGFAVIAVLMIAILYNDIIRSIFGPAKG
ncbi:MAG TPA: site-2 protease family protein, partial [Thermoanaerobaculia bacterium]